MTWALVVLIVVIVVVKWTFLLLPDSWTGERMAALNLGPPKEDPVDKEKYPMCEKLASLSHERRVLVDFIEWLQTERRGMEIYDLHTEKDVLAFLEIDPVQLERERWQMLDELHKKAEEKADG